MEISEAKKRVLEAGKELVRLGLISRTWGNISCRIDESSFVVTPSGRNYLSLSEEEIVPIQIGDLSYEGSIEPSSESRIHAAAYQLDPCIGFIVHTHQENASILSCLGRSAFRFFCCEEPLGDRLLCAEYALPGSSQLCQNTIRALRHSEGPAVLMANHGALCTGRDDREAFQTAAQLEKACGMYLEQLCPAGTDWSDRVPAPRRFLPSRREGSKIILMDGGEEHPFLFRQTLPEFQQECAIYRAIYSRHPNISYISVADHPDLVRTSLQCPSLRPCLDDFAQIVGAKIPALPFDPKGISRALSRASAVLLQGVGALCCGQTQTDAEAIRQICTKNARAYWYSAQTGNPAFLKWSDTLLMRRNYLSRYAKRF